MDVLMTLNRIDAQVYGHAVGIFLRLCGRYGIELDEELGRPEHGESFASPAMR